MKIKKALIDLSGTIHVNDAPITNSVNALKRLRESGVAIKFVTNTSTDTRRALHRRLVQMGFDELHEGEIFTSVRAALAFVEQRRLNPLMIVDDKVLEEFEGLSSSPPHQRNNDAVLVGHAPDRFDYHRLNEAFRLLKNGAPLIAINEGRYHQTEAGLSLGPGLFVKGLEYAADCTATVIGKPSANFFLASLEGTPPSEAVMIGDDVRDDVGGAQAVDIRGILVKTGKYRDGDEGIILPKIPFYVAEDFSDAVDKIIAFNKNYC